MEYFLRRNGNFKELCINALLSHLSNIAHFGEIFGRSNLGWGPNPDRTKSLEVLFSASKPPRGGGEVRSNPKVFRQF